MKIGRYEVQGEIARGGFGVVLRARDPALNRDVAIKLLLGGAGAGDVQRKRFEREVKALARLRHPNIVAVHEAGFVREGPFVVMDLIEGESLERRLELTGPLPVRDAVRLMESVARAIAHAHAQGLLHRDLKPANVLIDAKGTPLVTDFGLAKEVDPRLSMTALSRSGAALGTPGFWPPEQAYGQLERIGPASDVYGLGATLYALLTGEPPYVAGSVIEVLGLMASPPKPPSHLRPEVPAVLDEVVGRAMAHEPLERYPSAEEFAAALVDARRRLSAAAPGRSRKAAALAGLLAAGGLVGGGVFVVYRDRLGGASPEARPPVAVASTTESSTPPSSTPVTPPAAVTAPPPSTEPPPPAPDAVAEAAVRLDGRGLSYEALVAAAREAMVQAEVALAARPDHVDALVLRARARALLDDLPGAAADATMALTLAPGRVDAVLVRLVARRHLKDAAAVIGDADWLLDLPPETLEPSKRAQVLANRAWARKTLGLTAGALTDYTEAVALAPTADLLVEVGSLSFELGHLDAALNDFSSALLLDPTEVVALINRAAVHLKQGDLEAALADADEAVRLMPESAWVWLRRVDVHRARSDWASGLRDAEQALTLDPDLAEAYWTRAAMRAKTDDFEGAIADYREALLREPDRPDVLKNLAVVLNRVRDFAGARAALDAALRLDPGFEDAYMTRAEAYEGLGELQAALDDYGRLLALNEERWDAHYNRGMLRGSMNDAAGARADYDASLALNPDHYQIWLNRGDLRRRTGDPQGALDDLRKAQELLGDDEDPNVTLAYGLALHELKDYEGAEEALTRYLKHAPEHARIIAERALVRERRGDRAGALEDYRRANALTPPDDPARVHAWTARRIRALEKLEAQDKAAGEGDAKGP